MRSLRSRLLVLWLLSLLACAAVSVLLVQLYNQSTAAQTGQAAAVVARACDLIEDRFAFYTSGWRGPVPSLSAEEPDGAALRRDLAAVVTMALARLEGVEGGIWQRDAGSLAYAYPTYDGGSRPKRDLPLAEEDRIRSINEKAAAEDQPVARRFASNGQALLLESCPLIGAIPDLSAWAMARVRSAPGFDRLRLGLGVLLGLVLASSGWLTRLLLVWSRHVRAIEEALARPGDGGIPAVTRTGEQELDRIVQALNDAGRRLAASQREASALAERVAVAERLASLGRVTAGVAHEIRNPLAAMRLRAENALASGDEARRSRALSDVLGQIARLDALVAGLLAMTQRRAVHPAEVNLPAFLDACAAPHRETASSRDVAIAVESEVARAVLDPEIVGRILDNLLTNALRHAPHGGRVDVAASGADGRLRVSVADTGPGIAPELRASLFEPFATGRAGGTGLGLAIARELAAAHGGDLSLTEPGGEAPGRGAVFALDLPQPRDRD